MKTLADVTPLRKRKFDELAEIGIPPGTRVMIGDPRITFINDILTPFAMRQRPATVLCHYGRPVKIYSNDLKLGPYESLIDVQFDDGYISKGHFTWALELLT